MSAQAITNILIGAFKKGLDECTRDLSCGMVWKGDDYFNRKASAFYSTTFSDASREFAESIKEHILAAYIDGAHEAFDFHEDGNVLHTMLRNRLVREEKRERRRKQVA